MNQTALQALRDAGLTGRRRHSSGFWRDVRRHYWLYILVVPIVIYFVIFRYLPMFGVVIAFERFSPFLGALKSPWVGLLHFRRFFSSIYFTRVLGNTFILNLYGLAVGFPAPIILALMLNEITRPWFKRLVQTATYLPYFISTVVVTGIILNFLNPTSGVVNYFISQFGGKPIAFMDSPGWFRHIYVWSDVWQYVGFGSIIYLAALTGIDPTLYESAEIDGAGRLAKMWHISIPGILPTIMVILLLSLGNMLSIGFEKVYLLYNPNTYVTADVISTYVYRAGFQDSRQDFATAVGLFNSVVNLVLLASFNWAARRLKLESLW